MYFQVGPYSASPSPALGLIFRQQIHTNTKAACDCSEQSHAAFVFVCVYSEITNCTTFYESMD